MKEALLASLLDIIIALQKLHAAVSNDEPPDDEPHTLPFVPTGNQELILKALKGVALRTDGLAAKTGISRRNLFRKGGLPELQEVGLVGWHERIGFYSETNLPPELTPVRRAA